MFFYILFTKLLIFYNFSKEKNVTSELIFGTLNLTLEFTLTSEPHFGAYVEISVGNHPIVPIIGGIFSSMLNYIDSPENHASEMIIFLRGTRAGCAPFCPERAGLWKGPIWCPIFPNAYARVSSFQNIGPQIGPSQRPARSGHSAA